MSNVYWGLQAHGMLFYGWLFLGLHKGEVFCGFSDNLLTIGLAARMAFLICQVLSYIYLLYVSRPLAIP